ncbi:hypothetical protein ACFQ3Y_02100 [Paenibacillus motobuensis]
MTLQRILYRQMQADEVEVFEMFGGDLSVWHHTVTVKAKRTGDCSDKPYGWMQDSLIFDELNS